MLPEVVSPAISRALAGSVAPSCPISLPGTARQDARKAARRQRYLLQRRFKENLHPGHVEAACSGGHRNEGHWSLGWHSPQSTCGAATTPSSCNGGRDGWTDRDLGTGMGCRSACSQPLDAGGCCTSARAGALFVPSVNTRVISSGGLSGAAGEMVATAVICLQSQLPTSSRTGRS